MFGYQYCGYEEQIPPQYISQPTIILGSCSEQRQGLLLYAIVAGYVVMRDYGPQSLKELQKEVDLDPTNAEACHELGYIHKSLGNHEKAIEALQKELGLDSSFTFS